MTPEAASLIALLRMVPYWITARDVSGHLSAKLGRRISDRRVRAIASSLGGLVASGPGGKGYKLTSHCSESEKAEIAARLRSQAKAMNKRAAAILRG